MKENHSAWLDAIDWTIQKAKALPRIWPPELPHEAAPDLWRCAAALEMHHRQDVSEKIRRLIAGELEPAAMPPLTAWFFRRRCQWAQQLALAKARQGVVPDVPLDQVLRWLLVDSWDSDGCIGFWNHAIERCGLPHPENPDGLSPPS